MPTRIQRVQSAIQRIRESVGGAITGKKRNPPIGETTRYLHHDLEIPEYITRHQSGSGASKDLVEMIHHCQPIKKATRVILDAVLGSPDGSDWGVSIDPMIGTDGDQTPVDELVRLIGDRVLTEIIGYETLRLMAKRTITYGDSFAEKVFVHNANAPLIKASLSGLVVLPTFQMFRVEDNQGRLQGFEQRLSQYQLGDELKFSPVQICHARYDQEYLYGVSFFDGSIKDWSHFKDACIALIASAKVAINPIKYTLPESWSPERRQQHIDKEQKDFMAGVIAQIFTTTEVEVERLSNGSTTVQNQVEAVLYYRRALKDNTRLPSYLWNDEPVTSSARDISGQPALCMAQMTASIRQVLSSSLREIIDTELILHGLVKPKERQYKLKWPPLLADPQALTREQQGNEQENNSLTALGAYALN